MVCNYKFFTGGRIWRNQTGEREPFWCTALIFTKYDGQCFMSPVIVRQESKYTQYLHYNITKDWVVHNTPSGHIYRDGWIKAMMHFKTVYGVNKIRPQVLFYDDHASHYDGKTIHIICSHHIKPFVLEAGDLVNDQPNNNGPNLNLNGIYGQTRMN